MLDECGRGYEFFEVKYVCANKLVNNSNKANVETQALCDVCHFVRSMGTVTVDHAHVGEAFFVNFKLSIQGCSYCHMFSIKITLRE